MKRLFGFCTAALTLLAAPSSAHAYVISSPNWAVSGPIQLIRMQCSVPDSYPWKDAYDTSSWYWNKGKVALNYAWYSNPSGCVQTHGNWLNEFARTDRANIGGKNGRTFVLSSGGDRIEADIMIAADVDFNPWDESWYWAAPYQGNRSTIVHEMGHLLSLDHAGGFSVMRDAPDPMAGGNTSEPMPDDILGVRANFPGFASPSPETQNFFTSAQYYEPVSQSIAPTMWNNQVAISVARGQTISVRYNIANTGLGGGWIPMRIFLNNVFSPTGGTTLWYGSVFLSSGTSYSEILNVTVPASTPVGGHWIFFQSDPTGGYSFEYSESDNTVHAPVTYNVTP